LAEKARPLLSGPEQVAWLNRLEVEHDNLRLALRWALENAQASLGIDPVQRSRLRQEALRLAGSLGDFWYMHGHWSEGRRWLQQALDQNTEDVTSIKAWALVKAGTLAGFQNDYAQAQALLDESFSLFQILGEKHGLGRTLFYLAMIASDQGDNPLSIRYVEESLALEKEVGDREGQAFSLHLLGEILNGLGEPQRAISYFQPSLALFREMGNQWAIALSLVTLGASAYYLGDYTQAAALEQEGLDRWRELGDTRMIAIALYELGRATLGLRDFTKTMAYWKESLQIFKNVGDRDFFNQCLEGLATLACRQRQWKRAARMYAAASAYRQEIGVPVYDADRAQLEQSLSMIKAGIGEEEFKKAWSEGSQMSPEQALEYASQVDETVLQGEHASTSTPLKRAKAQYGGLTAREREVAALIAKGRSNTEIARELYVGLRTVEAHVTAILTKLSFHSRTQIAGWAIDKGLAPPPR
jgi:non-specific serine/threonine protein kinase